MRKIERSEVRGEQGSGGGREDREREGLEGK